MPKIKQNKTELFRDLEVVMELEEKKNKKEPYSGFKKVYFDEIIALMKKFVEKHSFS